MRRVELEHAIRAATEIVQDDVIIVVGSQAILGSFGDDELPAQATQSIEVDMAPMNDDDAESLATRLDGALGEWSAFHSTYGYYVQGVGRETAVLPTGWEERLVAVSGPNTNGRTGLCLEPHDLCLAKLVAHREKDLKFVDALIDAGLIDPTVLAERVDEMHTADPRSRATIKQYLEAHHAR
jgi:hypothetical protein